MVVVKTMNGMKTTTDNVFVILDFYSMIRAIKALNHYKINHQKVFITLISIAIFYQTIIKNCSNKFTCNILTQNNENCHATEIGTANKIRKGFRFWLRLILRMTALSLVLSAIMFELKITWMYEMKIILYLEI